MAKKNGGSERVEEPERPYIWVEHPSGGAPMKFTVPTQVEAKQRVVDVHGERYEHVAEVGEQWVYRLITK
jgi:hypothetical protein